MPQPTAMHGLFTESLHKACKHVDILNTVLLLLSLPTSHCQHKWCRCMHALLPMFGHAWPGARSVTESAPQPAAVNTSLVLSTRGPAVHDSLVPTIGGQICACCVHLAPRMSNMSCLWCDMDTATWQELAPTGCSTTWIPTSQLVTYWSACMLCQITQQLDCKNQARQ